MLHASTLARPLRILALASVVLLSGLALTGAASTLAPATAHADADLPAPGKRAKAGKFKLKTLDGDTVRLSKLKGKVVVLSFWATWCKPCMQELRFMSEYYSKHEKDGLVILAVSTDGPETAAKIRSTAKRQKFTMPVVHDREGKVANIFNPRGSNPYTVFIDRAGRVVKSHEGYNAGEEKEHYAIITKLLAEKAP